jgi:hypothetical protein
MPSAGGGDDLVAIMAHALMNSAAVILAQARLLREEAGPLTAERRTQALDCLVEQASFVAGFCEDLVRLGDPSLVEALDRIDEGSSEIDLVTEEEGAAV